MIGTAVPGVEEATDRSSAGEPVSPERLIYFSDAVIAIALTLLALELPVPGADVHGNAGVAHFVRAHLTEYAAFLISFCVVAMHWMFHQRLFRYARGLTGGTIRWNLLWLLTIVVMPFATKLLTSEADAFQVQFVAYAAVQALAGVFLRQAFRSLRRPGLLRADLPAAAVASTLTWITAVVVTFALSIPLALVSRSASLAWTLLPLVRLAIGAVGRRRAPRAGG
jgi:uncharacterized membrane protein